SGRSPLIPIADVSGTASWVVAMFLLSHYGDQRDVWRKNGDSSGDGGYYKLPVYMFCQYRARWFQCVAEVQDDDGDETMMSPPQRMYWTLMAKARPPRPAGCYAGVGTRHITKRGRDEITSLIGGNIRHP